MNIHCKSVALTGALLFVVSATTAPSAEEILTVALPGQAPQVASSFNRLNARASSPDLPLFAQLKDTAASQGLEFLVIGGRAVIQHGFQRARFARLKGYNCSNEEQRPADRPSDELVLPDWSGQVTRAPRMPMDQWLEYCRSHLSQLRQRPGYAQRRRRNGIPVEFVL